MENLGKKIKEIRISKDLTQRDMAKRLDMVQGSYQRIEAGQTSLTIDRLKQIADVFEMGFFELIGASSTSQDSENLKKENRQLREDLEFLKIRTSRYKMELEGYKQMRLDIYNDIALLRLFFEKIDNVQRINTAYKSALNDQNESYENVELAQKENAWKSKLTAQEYFSSRLVAYLKILEMDTMK